MSNKELDIMPRNGDGEAHGLWESYWDDGKIAYKVQYVNGEEVGYDEWGSGSKVFHLV